MQWRFFENTYKLLKKLREGSTDSAIKKILAGYFITKVISS